MLEPPEWNQEQKKGKKLESKKDRKKGTERKNGRYIGMKKDASSQSHFLREKGDWLAAVCTFDTSP